MPATKEQSDWVSRVLGVAVSAAPPQDALRATVAAMIAKTEKAAAVVRPLGPPRQPRTERLLAGVIAKPIPADPMDMPAHVEAFVADFLVSVEAERPAGSQKLGTGSAVPGPDQILAIADLFVVTQSAMREWERLLDLAESADSTLDVIEDQEEDRDATEYADTLVEYNTCRKQTIAAEAKAVNLMAKLQAVFDDLSETARAQALREGGDGA